MSSKLLERVQRLTGVWGPSGREQRVARLLEEMVAPHVDEVRYDRLGNLLAVKRGKEGGRKVLLTAHMDTPGAVALKVSEKGLIYLAPAGSLEVHEVLGHRLVWGSGAVGVVRHEPVKEPKDLEFRKLFCDIGAASRDEALARVPLGDIGAVAAEPLVLGDRICAPGLDNRAGCAVLVEVAERLGGAAALRHEVTFAFTVQGASTPRGAAVAAYGAEPDLALIVDGSPAVDVPRGSHGAPALDAGPALTLKDAGFMAHQALAERIRSAAEAAGIPIQPEVGRGRSEGQAVAAAGPGVPAAVIGIPVRYRGTAGEMVSLRDLHRAADLLLGLLADSLDLDRVPVS